MREEVAVLVAEIEAYRAENGTLPPPAMFAPYLERGYQYQITDPLAKRFLVRRFTGEATVTYDGSLPLGLWLVLGEYPAERN